MRFSILTVTFNAEKYLRETLQSVKDQNFKDFEHLLWDGGSTDSTLEIAEEFSHVKVYRGKDEGISDAMNRVAELAQGQYIHHLHADDLFAHADVLSSVDLTFRLHDSVRWLYGQTKIINEESLIVKEMPFVPFSAKRLKRYNIISHPATFIERELFLKVGGFKKELKYCMDYDLWLRLAQLSEPLALPSYLAYFREHTASLSTSQPLKVADEAYKVRNLYLSSLWERFESYRTWKRRRNKILERANSNG